MSSINKGAFIAQWLMAKLPDPAGPSLIPGIPKCFSEKKLLMLMRFISGASAKSSAQQRLNNIVQTYLVLASGKLVLQKN